MSDLATGDHQAKSRALAACPLLGLGLAVLLGYVWLSYSGGVTIARGSLLESLAGAAVAALCLGTILWRVTGPLGRVLSASVVGLATVPIVLVWVRVAHQAAEIAAVSDIVTGIPVDMRGELLVTAFGPTAPNTLAGFHADEWSPLFALVAVALVQAAALLGGFAAARAFGSGLGLRSWVLFATLALVSAGGALLVLSAPVQAAALTEVSRPTHLAAALRDGLELMPLPDGTASQSPAPDDADVLISGSCVRVFWAGEECLEDAELRQALHRGVFVEAQEWERLRAFRHAAGTAMAVSDGQVTAPTEGRGFPEREHGWVVALARGAHPATVARLFGSLDRTRFSHLVLVGAGAAQMSTRAITVDLTSVVVRSLPFDTSEFDRTVAARVGATPPTAYDTDYGTTLEASSPERWRLYERADRPIGTVVLVPDASVTWPSLLQSISQASGLVLESGLVAVWTSDLAAAIQGLGLSDPEELTETDAPNELPAIRGTVRPLPLSITPRVDESVMRRELRWNLGAFRECYENGLRRNPVIRGRLTLSWIVNADGEVLIVVPKMNTTGDLRVERCIVRALEQLRFSPLVGAREVRVDCGLELSPVDWELWLPRGVGAP